VNVNSEHPKEGAAVIYVKESQRDLDDVCNRLEAAAQENSFGVLGVHDLKEEMAAKGVSFDARYRSFVNFWMMPAMSAKSDLMGLRS